MREAEGVKCLSGIVLQGELSSSDVCESVIETKRCEPPIRHRSRVPELLPTSCLRRCALPRATDEVARATQELEAPERTSQTRRKKVRRAERLACSVCVALAVWSLRVDVVCMQSAGGGGFARTVALCFGNRHVTVTTNAMQALAYAP